MPTDIVAAIEFSPPRPRSRHRTERRRHELALKLAANAVHDPGTMLGASQTTPFEGLRILTILKQYQGAGSSPVLFVSYSRDRAPASKRVRLRPAPAAAPPATEFRARSISRMPRDPTAARWLSLPTALDAVLRRAKVDVTTHGFRSSFRDWAGDRTAFARDVVEAALAHAIENKTEAAYRPSDALEKRRKLTTAWSAFCNSAAKTLPPGANLKQSAAR